jgi:hypothetical protein
MLKIKTFLSALAMLAAASISGAEELSPLHNPINGLDVDGNNRIQAHDALLVINVLLEPHTPQATATALAQSSQPTYYWDTNNDFRVSARDALLVISALTTVPEPSSVVLAGAGLAVLAGYAWRRRTVRK